MWPPKVLRQLARINTDSSGDDISGAYNKLLYTLFPVDSYFTVVPRYMPQSSNKEAALVVTYEC